MIPAIAARPDVKRCDAAPRLLDALAKIAAIPLWGEPIAEDHLKAELLDAGEYDRELDQFEPSACSSLRPSDRRFVPVNR